MQPRPSASASTVSTNDEVARLFLANLFPDRDILQIDALDIVEGGGGIHCITQQEPA